MARVPAAEAAGIYEAAAVVRERALLTNGSVFTRSRRLWQPDRIAELRGRITHAPPGATFAERWDGALADASPPTVQLAGEVCFVHVLFAADLAPATKRGLVVGTLQRSPRPPRVPEWLDAALDEGVTSTGIAFKARRLSQLVFLLDMAAAAKALRRTARETILGDPLACKEWLAGLSCDGAQAQREALAHLCYPDVFEPIVSVAVKRRIVAAHADLVPGEADDVDVALLAIRGHLAPVHGTDFSWADEPLAAAWRR